MSMSLDIFLLYTSCEVYKRNIYFNRVNSKQVLFVYWKLTFVLNTNIYIEL